MLIVIIPSYEAESGLSQLLPQLAGERVIVSDGGSVEGSLLCAAKAGASLACGAKGRGAQLRLGAHLAALSGDAQDWYLFLHADSSLPDGWRAVVARAMTQRDPRYFRFKAEATGWRAVLMNRMVGLRCWALRLPYGDQGLLVSRALYEQVGGYGAMPLFEDVDIVGRLKHAANLRPLPASLSTDVSQHWENGVWRRGLRNLRLLWRYKRGASVEELRQAYRQ